MFFRDFLNSYYEGIEVGELSHATYAMQRVRIFCSPNPAGGYARKESKLF